MNYREHVDAAEFIAAANRFTALLLSTPQDHDKWLKEILAELSLVYRLAHKLPETDCGDPESDVTDRFEVTPEEIKTIASNLSSIFGESRWYACVFPPSGFPAAEDGVCCGDLVDDLTDIYKDIVPGLRAWEASEDGLLPEIIWDWKAVSFQVHWGVHATQAMAILHWITFQEGSKNACDADV